MIDRVPLASRASITPGASDDQVRLVTPWVRVDELADALCGLRAALAGAVAAEGLVSAAARLEVQVADRTPVPLGRRARLVDVVAAARAVLAGTDPAEVAEPGSIRVEAARTREGVPMAPIVSRGGGPSAGDEALLRERPPHH